MKFVLQLTADIEAEDGAAARKVVQDLLKIIGRLPWSKIRLRRLVPGGPPVNINLGDINGKKEDA
jgi:hypothetical protein